MPEGLSPSLVQTRGPWGAAWGQKDLGASQQEAFKDVKEKGGW